jgi:hypothetical protein
MRSDDAREAASLIPVPAGPHCGDPLLVNGQDEIICGFPAWRARRRSTPGVRMTNITLSPLAAISSICAARG